MCRLLSRPDVIQQKMNEFLEWSFTTLTTVDSEFSIVFRIIIIIPKYTVNLIQSIDSKLSVSFRLSIDCCRYQVKTVLFSAPSPQQSM